MEGSEVTKDLADELERLAKACLDMARQSSTRGDTNDATRLRAKASAYAHASEMALSALRGEPCRECQAVSAAIGSVEFMDPPDGGDVPLSEQVRRMRAALDALRAKPEREPVAWPDREAVAGEIIRAIEAYDNSAIPESWDAAKTAALNAADAILALPQAGEVK